MIEAAHLTRQETKEMCQQEVHRYRTFMMNNMIDFLKYCYSISVMYSLTFADFKMK